MAQRKGENGAREDRNHLTEQCSNRTASSSVTKFILGPYFFLFYSTYRLSSKSISLVALSTCHQDKFKFTLRKNLLNFCIVIIKLSGWLGMVVHVCNPAAGKVEVGGLWLKANPGKVRLI
jgi:hypothetical protein